MENRNFSLITLLVGLLICQTSAAMKLFDSPLWQYSKKVSSPPQVVQIMNQMILGDIGLYTRAVYEPEREVQFLIAGRSNKKRSASLWTRVEGQRQSPYRGGASLIFPYLPDRNIRRITDRDILLGRDNVRNYYYRGNPSRYANVKQARLALVKDIRQRGGDVEIKNRDIESKVNESIIDYRASDIMAIALPYVPENLRDPQAIIEEYQRPLLAGEIGSVTRSFASTVVLAKWLERTHKQDIPLVRYTNDQVFEWVDLPEELSIWAASQARQVAYLAGRRYARNKMLWLLGFGAAYYFLK